MPKREDMYWAAQKEEKGRGICPFCGSTKVYYNNHYQSWKCGSCEKSFPSPSYGPGRDIANKSDRLGRIMDEIKLGRFFRSRVEKPDTEWDASRGFRPSTIKTLLIVILIALLLTLVSTVCPRLLG